MFKDVKECLKRHRKTSHVVRNAVYIIPFLKWFFLFKQQVLWFLMHYVPHLKKAIFLQSKCTSLLLCFGFEGNNKLEYDNDALFWVSPEHPVLLTLRQQETHMWVSERIIVLVIFSHSQLLLEARAKQIQLCTKF